MKIIKIIFLFVLATGCYTAKKVRRIFNEKQVSIFTNLDSAITANKEYLLFLVFDGPDSTLYNSPITTTLKMDTTKDDVLFYEALQDYYAVVKFRRPEFNSLLDHLHKYKRNDHFEMDARHCNPGKSFMFICSPGFLYLYGLRTLDSPKEDIFDLIWAGMGP